MSQPRNRIDVHHHFLPPQYIKALSENGGDPSGWRTPQWSLNSTKEFMASNNISATILSLTAPGVDILAHNPVAASQLVREINTSAASIRDSDPSKFGFFAALPSLINQEDALAEIAYALDELNADGVTLFTRYGNDNHYLGHPDFKPIWDELDRRAAVVFIHPTHPVDTNLISPQLPQPLVDYPHETTRAAIDLLMSSTVRTHPNCKIILPHAGGTLPYIASRPGALLPYPELGITITREEFFDGARNFYFDLAGSGNEYTLGLLEKFAKPGKILFGSDFPYVPTKAINIYLEGIEAFKFAGGEEARRAADRENALKLFPRLCQYQSNLRSGKGDLGMGDRFGSSV